MGVLINPFNAAGRAARQKSARPSPDRPSSGYFSDRTARRARHYRDVSWVRLCWQALTAGLLVLAGFAIGPGFGGPLLGLAGAALALLTFYVVALKAYGTTQRR